MKNRSAFSLIEISIVILIVGILMAGVIKGSRLISGSRLSNAQTLTTSTSVASIPNLTLWLEPTIDGSVTGATNAFPDNNEAVSSWNDRNPQTTPALKINPSQSTSSYRPLYVVNGIGGLPSLSFDGSNDHLRTSSGGLTPIGASDDTYTMVVVWRQASGAAIWQSSIIAETGSTLVNEKIASVLINASSTLSGFSGSNDNYIGNSITALTPYISIIRVNNAASNNISTFYNTNTSYNGTSNGTPANLDLDNSFFEIGALLAGTSSPFKGMISEILIFDRNLKDSEIAEINSYLGTKYSIRVN